jgi:aldose 1-epimerase
MPASSIVTDRFGIAADGTPVDRYTLANAHGMRVRIVSYGATVTELLAPDRHGELADVVLGFDNLRQYETESPYFGSTVGRVAFRIAQGRFTLEGKLRQLACNVGPHHLHGGVTGLSKVVWRGQPQDDAGSPTVTFSYRSPAGDQGYPGNLDVAATYRLTADNALRIDYAASTDASTPVNLTHHSYFNLAGKAAGDVLGHELELDADRYTPTNADSLPTGEIRSVRGTPFDFQTRHTIGSRIDAAGGYDLSYLRREPGRGLTRVATLADPLSGRRLDVLTTSPALVLYAGNYLDGSLRGKSGVAYGRHAGVCLETGHLPDAVNHPAFGSTIVRPGETYRETCIYRFGTDA